MMQFLKSILFRGSNQRLKELEAKMVTVSKNNADLQEDVQKLIFSVSEMSQIVREVANSNQALYSDVMLLAAAMKDMAEPAKSYDDLFSPFNKDDDDGYLN